MLYSVGDPAVSTVRVLRFFHTNILSTASRTDSLWIGTNGGMFIYNFFISCFVFFHKIFLNGRVTFVIIHDKNVRCDVFRGDICLRNIG